MKDKPRTQHGHTRKPSVSTRVWPLHTSCTTNLPSTLVGRQLTVAPVVDRHTIIAEIDNGNDNPLASRATSTDLAPSLDRAPSTAGAPSQCCLSPSEGSTSTALGTTLLGSPGSHASPVRLMQRQPPSTQPASACGHWHDVDLGTTAAPAGNRLSHPTPPARATCGRRTPRKQSNPARWTPLSRPKRSRPHRAASVSDSPAYKRLCTDPGTSVNIPPSLLHLNANPPTRLGHSRKRAPSPVTPPTGHATPQAGPLPLGPTLAPPVDTHATFPLDNTPTGPPRSPAGTETRAPRPAVPHPRYLSRACKPPPPPPPPDRKYIQVYPAGSSARVGLAESDIPLAGWGVFALRDLRPGTLVMEYGGVRRDRDWAEQPSNDARYVWSDENQADELEAAGREVLYIDANPALSDSWGGRVNDGFHRGSNLTATRLQGRDTVMLKVTVPVSTGEELYLSYGADYWQGHFFDLPPEVQAEAAAHYDLLVLDGTCYTPAQRGAAAKEGLLHKRGGQWHTGPPPPPLRKPSRMPYPPIRLPRVNGPPPLTHVGPTHPSPPIGNPPEPTPQGDTLDGHAASPAAVGHIDVLPTVAGQHASSPPRPAEVPPHDPDRAQPPTPSPGSPLDSHLQRNPSAPVCPDPIIWGHLLSSPIANCLRIGWAPTASTIEVLTALLRSTAPDIGRLFAQVTGRDSAVAFRYWRTTTGPPSPWFHPGPLDGIIADYVMKARAASGHRSPKKHGTLDIAQPGDADVLRQHCRAVGLLPDSPLPSEAAADGDSPHWGPAAYLLPDDLIRLQDPTLAYSCFRTTGLPPDAPSPPQMGLCQFDSRLAHTWDFTWADLQVIGSSPNYCAHSPSGYTPVILPAPDWEVERIRWGIHSLCQHTIEAVLNHSQGPPPPIWTRRRRPDGQSSFVPTHPAGRTHLGPPRRPPRADGFDPPAPHTGLPEGTGWCPDAWWSTLPSDILQREHGPFSLAFQGIDLGSKADLTVASLNTNGLNTAKLTELLWLRASEQIDVLILVDTRCSGRQLKFLGRQAREAMGIGSWTLGSPARSLTTNGRSTRHELVGGQLILINPKWGRMVRSSRMDPTGLGVLTEVTLGASGGDILILGTYFPCPSGSCNGYSNKLWDKVQAWLGSQGRAQSPQAYLQTQLQDRVLRHLGRGATSGAARRNIALIGGDFNSSWSGHAGPLRGLGGWATASSLLSPVASLAATHPICSYFQGGTPKSLIDHILLSQPSQGDIARAGVPFSGPSRIIARCSWVSDSGRGPEFLFHPLTRCNGHPSAPLTWTSRTRRSCATIRPTPSLISPTNRPTLLGPARPSDYSASNPRRGSPLSPPRPGTAPIVVGVSTDGPPGRWP